MRAIDLLLMQHLSPAVSEKRSVKKIRSSLFQNIGRKWASDFFVLPFFYEGTALERKRQADRQSDIQRDRYMQTDRQVETETERQRHTDRDRQRVTERQRKRDRQTDRQQNVKTQHRMSNEATGLNYEEEAT